MAGIHADRGDRSHRLTSGEVPVVGMRVWNNDCEVVTITKVSTEGECGWYCTAWHKTVDSDGRPNISNCERLGTSLNGRPVPPAS